MIEQVVIMSPDSVVTVQDLAFLETPPRPDLPPDRARHTVRFQEAQNQCERYYNL